jgi:hypothetical protein
VLHTLVSTGFCAVALSSTLGAMTALAACPGRGIDPSPDPSVGYKDRGGRCEGLFRQPVAASAKLAVIGLHRHEPDFSLDSGKPITVAVKARGSTAAISLRVLSSRQRQYYRMDAVLGTGTQFVWPRDIVEDHQVRLMAHEAKAIACERICDVSEPRLMPVSITEGRQVPSNGITLWMRAALDLRQLFVFVEGEHDRKPVLPNEDVLEGRMLPAGAAKDVFLGLGQGVYRLRATAVPIGNNAIDEMKAILVVQ